MALNANKIKRGIEKTLPMLRLIADRTNSADDNALVEFLEVVLTLDAEQFRPLSFENPDDQ